MSEILQQRLRALRAEKNLNQQEVADAVHLSLRGYRKIEKGESTPSLDNIIEIANLYQVSIDYIAGRSESRK